MQITRAMPIDAVPGEFRASIDLGGTEVVFVRSPSVELCPSEDALFPMMLEPSMSVGGILELPAGLSPAVHEANTRIQDLLTGWSRRAVCPPFYPVELQAPVRSDAATVGPVGVGAFFSGGIDSTYTALKHRDEITHLVFVEGFDVDRRRSKERSAAIEVVKRGARAIGKPLVVVETNLREFSDGRVNWEFYHGAALATIAHLMSNTFWKVYVPSSTNALDPEPWGSHPLLDPLWSNDRLLLVNDGEEHDRTSKLQEIRDHPEALASLRVCWERPGATPETINCGRCRKCAGAILALRTVGMAGLVPSLPVDVAPEVLSGANLRYRSWRKLWITALLEELNGGSHDMTRARALAAALLKSYVKRPAYAARRIVAAMEYRRRSEGNRPRGGVR